MAKFTDYTEEFFEAGEPSEPGEEIPEGEIVAAGQTVSVNGITRFSFMSCLMRVAYA